jgi:hypothetical protein
MCAAGTNKDTMLECREGFVCGPMTEGPEMAKICP